MHLLGAFFYNTKNLSEPTNSNLFPMHHIKYAPKKQLSPIILDKIRRVQNISLDINLKICEHDS